MDSVEKIVKPWGHELVFARTRHYAGKILFIRKGASLSLQYHEQKEESIYLVKGRLKMTLGDHEFTLSPGQNLHIPPKTRHRMRAIEESEVFEVSTPHLNDVVRLQDEYGRV